MPLSEKQQKRLHYTLVIVIFAITGSTAAYIGKPILRGLGCTSQSLGLGWYIVAYLAIITPLYQALLLVYAWLFGKFDYFWAKQKALFRKMLGK